MNKRKLIWILPILAVSAVLFARTAIWRESAQEMQTQDDILVSEEDSFHAGDLRLELSNKSKAPIYYTMDGSVPTLGSPRYTEPLVLKCEEPGIVSSCVIRAASYDESTGTWGEWRSIQDALDGNSLFAALMQRKDMQERFAFYMEKCIHEYFTEERVREAIEELKVLRDKELSENIAYKKRLDENYALNMESVEANIEIIYEFLKERPDMMKEEVLNLFGIRLD